MPDERDRREVAVTLPSDVYERLAGDGETVAETLADLAEERARLRESIARYTGDGEVTGEAGPGAVLETPPPIAVLLGFDDVEVGPGRGVISFRPGRRHANPMGTLHGGVLCDLGDAAMGTAFASTLEPGESFATLELDVKFLRPVWDRPLTAEAEVVERGRTTGLVECDVTGPDGDLVARLHSVCTTLRGEQAAGR